MTYTAGYGDVDKSPTEEKTFDTIQEAQEWLDPILATLPSAKVWEEEQKNAEGEALLPIVHQECSWHSWITNNDN
jgi:hypothetical protein